MAIQWPPVAFSSRSRRRKRLTPGSFSRRNRRKGKVRIPNDAIRNQVESSVAASPGMTLAGKNFGKALARLKQILPAGEIIFQDSVLEKYQGDKWFATHKPDAVALPRSTKSVSALLRFANQNNIPATPRGA